MRIRGIMTPNPSVVTGAETIERATVLMSTRRVGFLPVIDNICSKQLVGVVTDRDIATRGVARNKGPGTAVRDVMTSQHLAVAHVGKSPSNVLQLMNTRNLRRIPVVDDRGRVVGVVTVADLSRGHGAPGALGPAYRLRVGKAAGAR